MGVVSDVFKIVRGFEGGLEGHGPDHLRLEEHLEVKLVILTAEGSISGHLTDFEHEIKYVLDWEHFAVNRGVLGVDSLHEGPILINQLKIVSVRPEVS